ncbi:MAG: glutathione S-transferase [Polyangiaceae bacterium]|nr:glutathione S-transferase [Polyangiaceae bacterium]
MSLTLHVISLRYSTWSMRALLPLWHAGAEPEIHTAVLDLTNGNVNAEPDAHVREAAAELTRRRALGSVTGLFPVLEVDGTRIHEALAICEWTAERFPDAGLWPDASLERAQARALSCEMASGFANLRTHMSSNPFARVPSFVPDGPTRVEIARVQEIWHQALRASGGPFLFGRFGIVDAMYFPVLLRFETYGVELPAGLRPYAAALNGLPAVKRWRALAAGEPRVPVYDAYVEGLGGSVLD